MKILTSPVGLFVAGLVTYWVGGLADFPALAGIGAGTMIAGVILFIFNTFRGK